MASPESYRKFPAAPSDETAADDAEPNEISRSANRPRAERVATVLCQSTPACDRDKKLQPRTPVLRHPTCSFVAAARGNRLARVRGARAARRLMRSTKSHPTADSVSKSCADYFGLRSAIGPATCRQS